MQPAVLEQFGEARIGARKFGAGDRVAGHQMHAFGQRRPERGDGDLLGRADIGHDGAGFQVRARGFGQIGVAAEMDRDDHEIGAGDRFGRILDRPVDDAQLENARPRLGAARAADQLVGQSLAPHHAQAGTIRSGRLPITAARPEMRHGPAPSADEGAQRRHRRPHLRFPRPTVMRRKSGRP